LLPTRRFGRERNPHYWRLQERDSFVEQKWFDLGINLEQHLFRQIG